MIKLFCDWCGKEIHKNDIKPESAVLDFPALVISYKNGKPCGEAEFDYEHTHTNRYDVCLDCIRKIWGLRHE